MAACLRQRDKITSSVRKRPGRRMVSEERRMGTYSSVRQPLDLVSPADNVHQRHSRNLSNSTTQIAIALGACSRRGGEVSGTRGYGQRRETKTYGGDDVTL